MKLPSRSKQPWLAVASSLVIGIGLGSAFSIPSASAASAGFVQTGSLALPKGGTAIRIEDKDYGIVCYMSASNGFPLGCAKK